MNSTQMMTMTKSKDTSKGHTRIIQQMLPQPILASPVDLRLIDLFQSSQGVPFFICAPKKMGRTSLALGYAQRQHNLDDVLWIDAGTDAFREAVSAGTLVEHLERQRTSGSMHFSLVVLDDLPSLDDLTASRISEWMDHLIKQGSEVLVITTPYEDCLGEYQSDRLLIEGTTLVTMQKWTKERIIEVLDCFFDAPIPQKTAIFASLMILMGRGIVDNLRELGYVIPAASYATLKRNCPLIEIDEGTGYFNAQGIPAAHFKERLLMLLNEAPRTIEEVETSEMERCFERLTQLSVHLFERSECERSQFLLELAGGLLTHDDAGSPLFEVSVSDGSITEPGSLAKFGSLAESGFTIEPNFAPDFATAPPTATDFITDSAADATTIFEVNFTTAPTAATDFITDSTIDCSAKFPIAPAPSMTPRACASYLKEQGENTSGPSEPETLLIRLFGDFEVFRGSVRVEGEHLHRSKVRALMIHLALNMGCGVSRDTLMERIWPSKTFTRAKDNFHTNWSRLNRLLANGVKPSPYLTNKRGLCRLEPTAVVVDTHEFEQLSKAVLFEQGSVDQRIETIYRLEQLYRGDVLSGCRIDSYIQAAQQRYRFILVDVMLKASELFSQMGNDTNAVWFARKAYDTDPTREDVYRVLMAMQDRAGQRTNALRTYFACKRFLSEELGILPSQKTTALYQELILDRR
jgi:DNA-binding SARP family transcriptional activator